MPETYSFVSSKLFFKCSTSVLASCVLSACFTAPCATLSIACVTCSIVVFVFPATSEMPPATSRIWFDLSSTAWISSDTSSIIPLKFVSSTPNSSLLVTLIFSEKSPPATRCVAFWSFLISRLKLSAVRTAITHPKIRPITPAINVPMLMLIRFFWFS